MVDLSSNTVHAGGVQFRTSPTCAEILEILSRRMPRVATYEDLTTGIWGIDAPENAYKVLQVMVCKLRKDLVPASRIRIETIYDRGYRLVEA